ncbi:MAG: CRISPR-associated endonuclease Cas2 [Balneolales bacterium]|nr:CRISPR-associated endonuclease Cas2 [Balneolales bacterium]
MWLFVSFDLPTLTATQRKRANNFRINIKKEGFTMFQLSVYTRHCGSRESADSHIEKVKKLVPIEGLVSIVLITDKQYGQIINIWGKKEKKTKPAPPQLEFF